MVMDLGLPIRGLAVGLIIAAPVGPVNVLCIQRTPDTLYGAIAGFSISLVIQFLIREEFWIRLIGGILLMGIGVVYYRKPPRSLEAVQVRSLAMLGLGKQRPLWQTSFLVAGIFFGSMTWWTILASVASLLRRRITDRAMRWMNRVAGIAIGGFGLVNVLLSRWHRH
jgi:arginine exporter protein ArgO